MEFAKQGPDKAGELSAYLYPIWHEVFDDMIIGGRDTAEYLFVNWTNPEAIVEHMAEGYDYGYIMHDGKRIGLYSTRVEASGRFYLNKLYLEKQYRGKGLGYETLLDLIECARSNKCSEFYLNVYYANERAIKAYLRAGLEIQYRCIGWLGNGVTRNDYLMHMKL